MATYNISSDPANINPSRDDVTQWIEQYKESFIEHHHDQSPHTLVVPDECLLVVGPPRLSMEGDDFYIVGLVNGFSYNETSQVQPFKALGSRRHIFSRTNQPVQGNIQRMMVLGNNLIRALYSVTDPASNVAEHPNTKFSKNQDSSPMDNQWFTNLEEDLYRYPFGLGIIYNSPGSRSNEGKESAGAEFLEICHIVSRQVQLQSGQTMVMENVQFMADRVVPWPAYGEMNDFEPSKEFPNDLNEYHG